jgi:hemin uptake protein HemP
MSFPEFPERHRLAGDRFGDRGLAGDARRAAGALCSQPLRQRSHARQQERVFLLTKHRHDCAYATRMRNYTLWNWNNSRMEPSPPVPPAQSERTVSIAADTVDSAALIGTARELLIRHGDATYRLRITSQNKMILTK